MTKTRKATVSVKGTDIAVLVHQEQDYISLTDIAKHKEPDRSDQVIQNWMRNRNTIEFLGIWERLNNPDFKPLEFEGFKTQAGLNSFVLTPSQWVSTTQAIGIISRPGRYGGTYAHKDILGLAQGERLKRLNEIAIRQMRVLTAAPGTKRLKA